MSNSFFVTTARLSDLDAAARAWAGTPFRHNSAVRGQGANCAGAVAGLLRDAGFPVPEFRMTVPTHWCRHQTRSVQEQWLDSQPRHFESICRNAENNLQLCNALEPGDLVGFRVGLCVHHLGVILPAGRFFQCSESLGAVVLTQSEPLFAKRLARIWRPLEL